jgi:hypothetical protein
MKVLYRKDQLLHFRHFMEPDAIDALKTAIYLRNRNRNTSSLFWKRQSNKMLETTSCLQSCSHQDGTNEKKNSSFKNGGKKTAFTLRDNQLTIPLKARPSSNRTACTELARSEQHNLSAELASTSPLVPRANIILNTAL